MFRLSEFFAAEDKRYIAKRQLPKLSESLCAPHAGLRPEDSTSSRRAKPAGQRAQAIGGCQSLRCGKVRSKETPEAVGFRGGVKEGSATEEGILHFFQACRTVAPHSFDLSAPEYGTMFSPRWNASDPAKSSCSRAFGMRVFSAGRLMRRLQAGHHALCFQHALKIVDHVQAHFTGLTAWE